MSAFVLAALPGTRVISVPHLTTARRVAEIEQLACTTGLTEHMTTTILQTLGHDSLAGEALVLAWLKVEQAIACRDATEPDDGDYEGYADAADDAINDFIHGTGTARGSGITSRGTAS